MLRIVSKEDSEIRLSESGQWFHQGDPFTNGNVIRFFHRAIRRDEDGQPYLYNRHPDWEERVYFEAAGPVYFVWDLTFDPGSGRFRVLLNTEAIEDLDVHTLAEDDRGVMYCRVLGGEPARFSQQALTRLSEWAKTDERGIYLDLPGEKVYVSGGSPPAAS